jgi:1,4-alpha-glucan branching enzyme
MMTKIKPVGFRIRAPGARQVLLSGTFNNWSESAHPMKRDEKGFWKMTKILPEGKHAYKFIVDGQWTLDPECCNIELNQYGTLNSVIEL